MSNPFAVLSVNEDVPSRKTQKKPNASKLTPAERAAKKEERERQKKKEQAVVIDTASFVIVDTQDDSGFISVDKKTTGTRTEKDEKLSKAEFISKKNRGEIVNRGNRNQEGGNRNQGGNRGGNRNQGGNRGGNRNQEGGNRNQGGNRGGKGGNKNQEGGNRQPAVNNRNQGKKAGTETQWTDNKTNPKTKDQGHKYVVKKDRKPRNFVDQKPQKKGGAGDFNWDDPIDADFESKVEEAREVVPDEIDLEPVASLESSEEWFHEEMPEFNTEEEEKKFLTSVKPEVKRVGLSEYLASKQEDAARASELSNQLSAHVRTLDVVIPAEANLNKKNSDKVADENDAFFFGPKQTSKQGPKKKGNQASQVAQVQFRMKRHKGYNMPKERKPYREGEEGQEESPKFNKPQGNRQGGNRGNQEGGNRNQGGNRQGGNRGNYQGNRGNYQGNRQGGNRKNPQLTKSSFPPLGGATTPPPVVNSAWSTMNQEE